MEKPTVTLSIEEYDELREFKRALTERLNTDEFIYFDLIRKYDEFSPHSVSYEPIAIRTKDDFMKNFLIKLDDRINRLEELSDGLENKIERLTMK